MILDIGMGIFRHPLTFRVFKYTIYALLSVNVYLFFIDDWQASDHVFSNGVGIGQIIEAFVATIDTGAWVILLLLFELETYVISEKNIVGSLKLTLHGVRVFCYGFILYSFYGYVSKCMMLYGFVPLDSTDLCALREAFPSFMTDLDEFTSITADNCHQFSGTALSGAAAIQVATDASSLRSAQHLAWADVINSATWLLVVLFLEIDVRILLKHDRFNRFLVYNNYIKGILYLTLLVVAIYWGVTAALLDFWDAFLWLVAFAFIEMNIFNWQAQAETNTL